MLSIRQNGGDYYPLYDGKGNIVSVLDSSQSQVAQYRYTTFGQLEARSGTFTQPFGFSTKRYDDALGLNYYGYRFYNPAIERWMNQDPLGEAGGINLYGFVGNNPINFVDPLGLWTVSVGVNVNSALGFGVGGGTSVNFGYSKKDGFSFSLTGTAQGGAIAGGGAFAGGSLTITDANNVNQLNGTSYQVGRSGIGPAYGEGVIGNGYTGATVGLGQGVGYTAGSVTADTTSAIFQYSNGVYSFGNTGTSSIWSSCDK